MPERHLVLVGLPGSGKSTVGPRVAQALGREFVDLDAEIERAAGRTIPEIFARDGEAAFRALERAESRALLASDGRPLVLAPGGGWIEDDANRALLGAGAMGVFLAVSPAVALARMGAAVEDRPLLAGVDPAKKLSELARRRNPLYLQCQHTVSVDSMTPDQVVFSIVALASREFGD